MSTLHHIEIHRCSRGERIQLFLRGDIEDALVRECLFSHLPERVKVFYSDPPWNPGNATYWRTHAGNGICKSYDNFLDSWLSVAAECLRRGAEHIFTEQSINPIHAEMMLAATRRQQDFPPLLNRWSVYYGSPGSASVRRPNLLFQFGWHPIKTDPSGMAGEPMTIRVCAGIDAAPGSWVIDPCMGKGMTSRMAHYFDWNCVGVELNAKRLACTLGWLERQGYKVATYGA